MRIVLFNLHYSPNLGDGVIADCIVAALTDIAPGAEAVSLDLSGRDGFGAVTLANRALALKVLRLMPQGMRQRAVKRRLGALLDGVAPRWRAALDGAEMAILGGGQILSDADLNFPLKIARAAGLAAEAGVPLAIHGAGVSRNWTPEGARLFNTVLDADLRAIGLRDAASMRDWRAQAAAPLPAPRLTRDPGLLADLAYGPAPRKAARIGLGVAAGDVLEYHADSGVTGGGAAFLETLALALGRMENGARLFCNGAPEDAAALARLARRPAIRTAMAEGRIEVAPVPARPAELAAIVAACRGVVAHRLHALILGYAYRRPIVGLGWDRKVESFLDSVGLSPFFAGPGSSAAAVADLTRAALDAGIDPADHGRVQAETRAALAETLAALSPGRAG